MENIHLSFAQTRKLIEVLAFRIINGNLGNGDGYSYFLNLKNVEFQIALASEGLTFQQAIFKVLRERQAQYQFLSFETWFSNPHDAMNLTQTKVILTDRGTVFITMSDGWTQEVHENVMKRLQQLKVLLFL